MVKAELITVGDELLIGQVVDTNSAWIGQRLGDTGAQVGRIVSVSDTAAEITRAVEDAMSRAQVVIMTGGLGPTKDDITKKTLAELFNSPLVRDEQVFEQVRRMNQERGMVFNELNQAQASVPECAVVLPNPVGTAPGMLFERDGVLLFSLPGVPFEMKKLIDEQVLPVIRKRFELQAVVHRTVVTFGIPESALALQIAPWEDALPEYLHLAYLPNARGIRLRLSAYDRNGAETVREIEDRFEALKEFIGPNILGYEPASMESAVAELLTAKGLTLAVAESCTGGSISARITALPGSSRYYLGGVTTYSNDSKINLLGVSPEDLYRFGAVSGPVAEQMARGALERFGSDIAVSTTGIAGPDGGTPEKPVGTVWLGFAYRTADKQIESFTRLLRLTVLREQNIARAATHALNMVRLHVLGLSDSFQQTGML